MNDRYFTFGASLLALGVLSACSAPISGAEQTSESEQAVVGGLANSTTVWNLSFGTSTSWESESAAVTNGVTDHYSWNAEDTNSAHVSYVTRAEKDPQGRNYVDRIVCPGTSQVMRAAYDPLNTPPDDDPWTFSRLPVPPGWSVLWGDPALALSDGKVWVSSIGSPTSVWNARSNTTLNGQKCYRTSNYPSSGLPDDFEDVLAGACVQGTSLGNFGNLAITCFRRSNGAVSSTGNDFFDGGSGATSSDAMYFAYADLTTSSLALYKRPRNNGNWSAVAGDTNVPTDFHALVLADVALSDIWVLTYQLSSSKLVLRRLSGSTWSSPVTVATGVSLADVTLKGGTGKVRGRNYAAQLLVDAEGEVAKILVAYQQVDGAFMTLTQKLCDGNTLSCTSLGTSGGTAKRENAFMPAIAVAHPLVSGAYRTIATTTYWSDIGFSDNTVVLRASKVDLSGVTGFIGTLTQSQKVCPGEIDYWGDYDASFVKNDFSASPIVYRAFSDSTLLTCDRTTRANLDFDNQDQHVSLAFFASPKAVP